MRERKRVNCYDTTVRREEEEEEKKKRGEKERTGRQERRRKDKCTSKGEIWSDKKQKVNKN